MTGDTSRDAVQVVEAFLLAWEAGDATAGLDLIDRDVVYINTGCEPYEIRGRDAYLALGASLHDLYTAPRSQEILGIDAFTPTMACLRVRVTVGDVSVLGLVFHYVRNGRLVEVIDVIEDRGRSVAPYINTAVLARLTVPLISDPNI